MMLKLSLKTSEAFCSLSLGDISFQTVNTVIKNIEYLKKSSNRLILDDKSLFKNDRTVK